MARILITGSADGLGQLSAKALAAQGHQVVLHARNAERGRYAQQHVPRAEHVIAGDLSDIEETKRVADEANALGRFDAVIHNAGVYQTSPRDIFTVNTLVPYLLTCLIHRPARLIYLSSYQISLAWLLSRPAVASVIVGAETLEELHANATAANVHLEPMQLDILTALAKKPSA